MNKNIILLKKIWFGIYNFILFPTKGQFNVLFWLNEQNTSKARQWFFISVIVNIFPFILSIILGLFINPSNIYCIANNGSIPILGFSILTTNLVYLIENMPTERAIYSELKSRTQAVSLILLLSAFFLYIFQSNFINHFTNSQLSISLIASIIILVFSITIGKKMFLLQNQLLNDFENRFKTQLDVLNQIPTDNDIQFG